MNNKEKYLYLFLISLDGYYPLPNSFYMCSDNNSYEIVWRNKEEKYWIDIGFYDDELSYYIEGNRQEYKADIRYSDDESGFNKLIEIVNGLLC